MTAVDPTRRDMLLTLASTLVGSTIALTPKPSRASRGKDPWPGGGSVGGRCEIGQPSPVPADEARFAIWNPILKAETGGRDVSLVDLDAVDRNIALVRQTLGRKYRLRIVTKSIPNVRLLGYIMKAACTDRVMAFWEGMVRELLKVHGRRIDILLGRPQAAEAADRIFEALEGSSFRRRNPAQGVRWLVDNGARLAEYEALARSRRTCLRINLEIDVGLRRGGARSVDELLPMLATIQGSKWLEFAGFMGYDGHVALAPPDFDWVWILSFGLKSEWLRHDGRSARRRTCSIPVG